MPIHSPCDCASSYPLLSDGTENRKKKKKKTETFHPSHNLSIHFGLALIKRKTSARTERKEFRLLAKLNFHIQRVFFCWARHHRGWSRNNLAIFNYVKRRVFPLPTYSINQLWSIMCGALDSTFPTFASGELSHTRDSCWYPCFLCNKKKVNIHECIKSKLLCS